MMNSEVLAKNLQILSLMMILTPKRYMTFSQEVVYKYNFEFTIFLQDNNSNYAEKTNKKYRQS